MTLLLTLCWQATVSCDRQGYQKAGARIRDDISIHQCDGSYIENRLYLGSDPPRTDSRVRFNAAVPCRHPDRNVQTVNNMYKRGIPYLRDGHRWFRQDIDFQIQLFTNCYQSSTKKRMHFALQNLSAVVKIDLSKNIQRMEADCFPLVLAGLDIAAAQPLGSQCSISVCPLLTPKHCFVTWCYDTAYMLLGSRSLSMQTGWLHWQKGFQSEVLLPVLNTDTN